MKTLASIFFLLLGLAVPPSTTAEAPLPLGNHRELFVDQYLIDSMNNLRLELQHPVDQGPILYFSKPWEGIFSAYVTVLHVGDKYQMYYRGKPPGPTPSGPSDPNSGQCTCYAESSDGIVWTKPELNLFPVGDSRTNIVLADAGTSCHNFCPFYDTKPGVPADEKYKAVGGYNDAGLFGFESPDGIHWRKVQDGPIVTKALTEHPYVFDSQNVPFWSETEHTYLLYYRMYENRCRRISRLKSDDFIHWHDPELMEYRQGDAPAPIEQLYTNQTQPYFRAPQIYIGTSARIMLGRQVLTTQQAEAIHVDPHYFHDVSDAILLTSRGGNIYQRTFLTALLAPGIGPENWVSRTNYPGLNIVQTGPTEMSLFVNQNYGQPTSQIHRYTFRLDGLAALVAEADAGQMVTKPLTFSGSELFLNFGTSAAGGIRVGIENADGTAIPGFALSDCQEQIGNEIERPVSWKGGDLSSLAGKPVRLTFELTDARLYAIRFGNPEPAQ